MAANGKGDKNHDLLTGQLGYGFDGTDSWALKAGTTDASSTLATLAVDVNPVKTIQTELQAITSIAASVQVKSSVLSLTGVKKVYVAIDHGRGATASVGAVNGTEYRVEVSQQASGNDTWTPIASVLTASGSTFAVASSGAVAAGTTVITILSGTALTIGDYVFWANTASAASSEWAKVVQISGTASFTILDGTTNAQAAAHTIYPGAERFGLNLDVAACTRLRVVINNAASGTSQAIYSRVAAITES